MKYVRLSKMIPIPSEQLEKLLTLKDEKNKKEYKLVPITKSKEYMKFWEELFVTSDSEYMKFWGTGAMLTSEEALDSFNQNIDGMYSNPPSSMTFIITLNGQLAGEIFINHLDVNKNENLPDIGYVISQKFSRRGIGTIGLKLFINFLEYLVNNKIYNLRGVYATAHPENTGSQKILKSRGFNVNNEIKQTCHGPRNFYTYYFN